MRVAYLIQTGEIEIKDRPTPEPKKGEIVVQVVSALTCGTDLKAYLRGHDLIPMPGPFGHEFSGIVAKKGKGVRKFSVSDEIMSTHSAPCNTCKYCERGLYNLCLNIMDSKLLGSFAEYVLLPDHVVKQNAYKKPADLSFDEAAMIEPLSCVVHPYSKINMEEVKTALVIGAGSIGLLHLLFLKMNGIKVIISDKNKERLRTSRSLGADRTATPDKLMESIFDKTSGMGVDLVVECTGQVETWEETVDFARRGGIVILFGGCQTGTTASFDTHRLHYDEITLIGSFHFTPSDVQLAYRLLAEKKIGVGHLITGSLPLKDIKQAFEYLRNGRGTKYSIHP